MRRLVALFLGTLFGCISMCTAQASTPIPEKSIPDALKPWKDWVLHEEAFRQCPLSYDQIGKVKADFACVWYGTFDLNASATGAHFKLPVEVYQEAMVKLPGDINLWPRQLSDGARELTVLNQDGKPAIWLKPGKYQLSGKYQWRDMPYAMPMPAELAVVSLRINDRNISIAQWENGNVLLGDIAQEQNKKEQLEISVFRLLSDGIPMTLETEVVLYVSGKAREQSLGVVLPQGFIPMALSGELGARLDPKNELFVQLRPGEYRLRLTARGPYLSASSAPENAQEKNDDNAAEQATESATQTFSMTFPSTWPDQEIWSWQSNDNLRSAVMAGEHPIDPSQTDMPDEWRRYPAFALRSGESVTTQERARGRQLTRNELRLQRDLWLRFDQSEYSFRDQINGTLRDHWRLDMSAPYVMQSARDGEQALPISGLEQAGGAGIELRTISPNLSISGAVAPQNQLPVTGWRSAFDSVSIILHLPPGFRLFAAQGVEQSYGSLLEQWNLLDTFIFVLSVVLVFKLAGPIWAAIFMLSYFWLFHETGMPTNALLNTLLALLAARHISGPLTSWVKRYRLISVAILIFVLVPFVAQQARFLLHPQLERDHSTTSGFFVSRVQMEAASVSSPPTREMTMQKPMADMGAMDESERKAERIEVAGSRIKKSDLYETYSDNLFSSAGQGVPSWQWNQYSLRWNSAVDANQSMNLWIMSYHLRVFIIGLSLLAFIGSLLFLLKQSFSNEIWMPKWPMLNKNWLKSASPLFMVVLMGVTGVLCNRQAMAETPSDSLLKELKARLTESPLCAPVCASIESANITATNDELQIDLRLRAEANTTMPIPGQAAQWWPTLVERNGLRVLTHFRQKHLHIAVPSGVHQIRLTGAVPDADRFVLSFPVTPVSLKAQSTAWDISGIVGDRLSSDALTLVRIAQAPKKADSTSFTRMSVQPFFRVERTFGFGTQWSVMTTVHRLAPSQGGISVSVPLVVGESVRSDGFDVSDGEVRVDLPDGVDRVQFESTLARTETLQLQAPMHNRWVEIWEFAPTNIWRIETSGTPQIHTEDYQDWLQTFAPRPGESLSVDIYRPELLTGQTLAFDQMQWAQTDGEREHQGNISVQYRATKAGEHQWSIPEHWQVSNVYFDGVSQMIRPKDGKLTLAIAPGAHSVSVDYKTNESVGVLRHSPDFDAGLSVANISLSRTLPENRWILFVSGPAIGPAVLYWSALLVFILIAWAIVRAKLVSLKMHEVLLLGFGLSTVSWWFLVLILSWLMAMKWRERQLQLKEQTWFNTKQVALIFLSLLALSLIMASVPWGLLSSPDMMLAGNNVYGNQLSWFADYSASALPQTSVFSVPIWLYKGLMLLWAIWLSFAVIRWIRFAWNALNVSGFWRPRPKKVKNLGEAQTPEKQAPQQEPIKDA